MDSFEDNTELVKMKRKFAASHDEDDTFNFSKTRHNLLRDFDETPAKVRKASEMTTKGPLFGSKPKDFAVARKEASLMEAEIITLKTSITQLQDRLSSSETVSRQSQIDHEKEIAKFRAEKERDANKVSELHSKLQYVMEKERNARETLNSLEKDLSSQKWEMDKKISAAQKEKRSAEDKAQAQKQKWHEAESNLHDQIIQQKKEIIKLQSMYGEAQAQLSLRERRDTSNTVHLSEVDDLKKQLKAAQEKVKALESQLAEHADNLVVTKALKEDLDLVPKMKSDLEKLRLDNEQLRYNEQNCLLLEEEVRSLKKKLELAETENKRIVELEVTNEELQGRLTRWEVSDSSGSRRPQSPSSLSRRVTELETSQASLTLKEGELQTLANSTKLRLEQAQNANQKLSAELAKERNLVTQHSDLIKRLKRKVLLLSKERDSYKSLLDSYENEVTCNFDVQKQAHTQRQEDVLQNYRTEAAQLEAEISRLTERLAETQQRLDAAQQELHTFKSSDKHSSSVRHEQDIRKAREQVAELEIKLAKVESERDILEARIEQRHLQGDYDPSKTKIVHISMNPCAVAQKTRQEEWESLHQEVEMLRKRNKILEEQGGEVEDLTIQVKEKLQHPSPSKELEEMKAQVKREEMRNQRLMEVFKKTSQEFREICYQLTGYKIDIPCSNQYRLTSMYAESPRDHLLFQQNAQGEIQMLETDFSTTLQEAMELYLKRQQSIPVFLSSITMDLFSRQTILTESFSDNR
ncbi:mitotic spindle assembly checkpoint protein MAD1 [Aplysia californica]|uniref:Mitotic spindle assembly checkpoint protein MAD1 n=1 Tax=Aplysia californica TaxID=6500 RepID=A0ABM0JG73_APLCA|nr:mitotic spindle assembly checkpoint protein MAD1 [Aplysia californica]XP_005092972.1 mitotic spindle assembly checkpoint protein MAD1 [Aplysia californica]